MRRIGLMLSGGLDSAILLGELLDEGHQVQPFYVATGCIWEREERAAISRYVEALDSRCVEPLVEFRLPADDLYGVHWSNTGKGFPDDDSPDEAVFMWGRNPMLLLKPVLWCQQHDICDLAIGTLAANPFADATQQFLDLFARALAAGVQRPMRLVQPFSCWTKSEVLARGWNLPLQFTFSCLSPVEGLHCGRCNKCAERLAALEQLPGGDPTHYAGTPAVPCS